MVTVVVDIGDQYRTLDTMANYFDHVLKYRVSVCMCVCVCVCVCVYVCVYMCVCMYVCGGGSFGGWVRLCVGVRVCVMEERGSVLLWFFKP